MIEDLHIPVLCAQKLFLVSSCIQDFYFSLWHKIPCFASSTSVKQYQDHFAVRKNETLKRLKAWFLKIERLSFDSAIAC